MEVQKSRVGLFSSSSIHMLASNGRAKDSVGAPFNTYVNQKRWERLCGRSIQNEVSSKETEWGNMCEPIAFDLLGLEYTMTTKKRYYHKEYESCGVPDCIVADQKVIDIKCPFTLNSFMQMYESEDLKKDKKEYYWQLVHNAILTGCTTAELILFMPKRSRIESILETATGRFNYMTEWDLPWTADDSPIPEITKKLFDVPKEDIDFLNHRLEMASKELRHGN